MKSRSNWTLLYYRTERVPTATKSRQTVVSIAIEKYRRDLSHQSQKGNRQLKLHQKLVKSGINLNKSSQGQADSFQQLQMDRCVLLFKILTCKYSR